MAVPKRKSTRASRGNRRSHDGLSAQNLSICSNCQEPRPAHRVCPKCGWYDGREVVPVEEE